MEVLICAAWVLAALAGVPVALFLLVLTGALVEDFILSPTYSLFHNE